MTHITIERAKLEQVLEALEDISSFQNHTSGDSSDVDKAITTLKQALSDATHLADSALDRMAENARELGLDYEPVQEQIAGFDVVLDKGMPSNTMKFVQPASEEDMKVYRAIADNYRKDLAAAQRQWVEVEQIKWDGDKLIAKLKENT